MGPQPAPEPPTVRFPLATLLEKYRRIRAFSHELCASLEPEDYVIQSMDDVSPTKWHLAHTSWFFETFLLVPYLGGYEALDARYEFLFNSYYNSVGDQYSRPHRGLLSRPTVQDVYDYRAHIDAGMERLLSHNAPSLGQKIGPVVEIGLNHEQQHQELILTDIKHVFSVNPLRPAFCPHQDLRRTAGAPGWVSFDEGIREIGSTGGEFTYDNEGPRHRVFLEPFALGSRLVTNEEYAAFIADGGYERPEMWLSEGWATAQEQAWRAPMYWQREDGAWHIFTLSGMREVDGAEPVCHLSYFEADAYARWAGFRLPTEFEWEVACADTPVHGNFVDTRLFHPTAPEQATAALQQMYGDVWEWTSSHYSPYPGYRPAPGAIGEYNGKFMCNQFVLRGGSCATSSDHIRKTYRNFFPAHARWQFSGLRLAREA